MPKSTKPSKETYKGFISDNPDIFKNLPQHGIDLLIKQSIALLQSVFPKSRTTYKIDDKVLKRACQGVVILIDKILEAFPGLELTQNMVSNLLGAIFEQQHDLFSDIFKDYMQVYQPDSDTQEIAFKKSTQHYRQSFKKDFAFAITNITASDIVTLMLTMSNKTRQNDEEVQRKRLQKLASAEQLADEFKEKFIHLALVELNEYHLYDIDPGHRPVGNGREYFQPIKNSMTLAVSLIVQSKGEGDYKWKDKDKVWTHLSKDLFVRGFLQQHIKEEPGTTYQRYNIVNIEPAVFSKAFKTLIERSLSQMHEQQYSMTQQGAATAATHGAIRQGDSLPPLPLPPPDYNTACGNQGTVVQTQIARWGLSAPYSYTSQHHTDPEPTAPPPDDDARRKVTWAHRTTQTQTFDPASDTTVPTAVSPAIGSPQGPIHAPPERMARRKWTNRPTNLLPATGNGGANPSSEIGPSDPQQRLPQERPRGGNAASFYSSK